MSELSIILGRPLPISTRSPASPSPPPYYQARSLAALQHQQTSDDLFGPGSSGSSSAERTDSPRSGVHQAPKLRQSPVFRTPALSPPMSASRLSGVAGTFSDDSIGGLGSTFGAQLRKGSRSAPWEEEVEADAAILDQRSDAGDTEGDHEAGWAALGLTNVDSVERRGSGQSRLRSPPATMYLRPISAREQFGQPRTPHSASLASAMHAFPSPPDEGDDSSSIPAYYSPAANNLERQAGLPSPSPSPEHIANATPTRSQATRARAPLRDLSNLQPTGLGANSSARRALKTEQTGRKPSVALGQAAQASRALPSPPTTAHETAPQKVIRAKKSLLKMFSKAASLSSPAPPIPVASSPATSHASHYHKTSTGRFPSPEPAAEAYSFMAPMTELSVRGCGESEFAASPSHSVISLSVEAPSRAATPPPACPTTSLQELAVSRSATEASLDSALSGATASPAPVKPLKLRPISQAWTAGLPTDFLALPQTSPDPSTLMSPGSIHSSLPSPSASSFATSGWSDVSSVVGRDAAATASGFEHDAVIRRLERELSEAAKAWQAERLEYQAEIRCLKATLADHETQARVQVATTSPSPSCSSSDLSSCATDIQASIGRALVESVPERISIMDRGRVKTGGGRAAFGRGDLRT